MTDLVDTIETNAQGPKQVNSDGHSATQHSLPEQIAADEYVKNQRAGSRTKLPIFKTRTIPGGTT